MAKTKRFYKQASAEKVEGGYAIMLDGRRLKTPGKFALTLASKRAAQLVAAEWQAQGEQIKPETMPCTRLLNVTLERAQDNRDMLITEVTKYAGTDVTCYRAVGPQALYKRQCAAWDDVLEWAGKTHGIKLETVIGIIAAPQGKAALQSVTDYASALDPMHLTLLAHFNAVFGSAILAIAVMDGHIDAGDALARSRVDELFQIEQWGSDETAQERAAEMETETLALSKLIGERI